MIKQRYIYNLTNAFKVGFARTRSIKLWITDFTESHSFYQLIIFVPGIATVPVYLIKGHFFQLLDSISHLVTGGATSYGALSVLLVETAAIGCSLVLLLRAERKPALAVPPAAPARHGCLVIKQVPVHLYNNEIKNEHAEHHDLVNAFSTISDEDRVLIEKLPQALEILQNNDALLDIYDQFHAAEAKNDQSPGQQVKTLHEILMDYERPEIKTAADLEKFIDTKS